MKWRKSFAIGCAAAVLISAIAGYTAAVKYGLLIPWNSKAEASPNVGPCFLSLTKMGGGRVRLSVLNVNGTFILVQRHGDDFGGITIEVRNIHGNWSTLDPINPYVDVDSPSEDDSDWVSLSNGDEVSWDLLYLTTGRLRAGDHVRLNWKTIGKAPQRFGRYGKPFPVAGTVVELTVGRESR
jgi:hypothetical protein